MTCLLFYLRYSHNALRFTNHVGEQRNFCKQKCDVPLLVCLSNSTLSAQRSAYFFKTLYGTTFPHTTRLHKFMNNQTLPLRAGCRGRQPLQSFRQIRCAAKSLRSLRILRCAMGWKKRCRVLCSDTALFCFLQLHYIFFRRRKCVCTVCRCCYYLPERCSTDISCHKKTLCSGDPILASFHISAFVKLANAL